MAWSGIENVTLYTKVENLFDEEPPYDASFPGIRAPYPVEAARAGEHGLGFAVVATEVRQLATRSQQASTEIRTLVQSTLDEVERGTQLASQAHAQMLQVVTASQQLTQVVGQVAEASRQQSDAAVRITPLLQQLQADSSHNAERVGQVSISTQALDEMARALHESLSHFQVDRRAA